MSPARFQLRAIVALSLVLAAFAALLGRLFWVQVVCRAKWEHSADAQQWTKDEVAPAQRGAILDRNGRPLAKSENAPTVVLDAGAITDRPAVEQIVAEELKIPPAELERLIEKGGRHFAYLVRQFGDRTAVDRVRRRAAAAGQPCFIFEEEPRRVHPQGNVAAQVLGFTDRDGAGLEGIERLCDRRLAGTPGSRVTMRDARAQEIASSSEYIVAPKDGDDVTLTIDATIQAFAEEAAQGSFEKHRPTGVVAAVIDVRTGELLGVACRPTFDLDAPGKSAPEARRDRFFVDIFEPGSAFKPLVMAAALDCAAVRPTDSFDCGSGGVYRVGRRAIHEDDNHHYGMLSAAGIIAKSSNVGMAQVGQRLGIERCYAAVKLFGFGTRTALAWPGESNGQMEQTLAHWNVPYTLCSVSFGHNIAVTPAQLLSAYAAVANDGRRVAPKLLFDGDDLAAPVRVVSPEAARMLRPMLEEVLLTGTARSSHTDDYRVCGKTGTADKLGKGGVVASFACFAPAEAPRLAVLVVCDTPTANGDHGSTCAAPYAVDLLRKSLHYLGVPRSGGPAVDAAPRGTALVAADPGNGDEEGDR